MKVPLPCIAFNFSEIVNGHFKVPILQKPAVSIPKNTLKVTTQHKTIFDIYTLYIHIFRLEYRSVSKEHAGTYGCTGNNGFGQPSTQLVALKVKCTKLNWKKIKI